MANLLTPIIVVTLKDPHRPNRRVQVDGLVDTGSDVSAIPIEAIRKLGLKDQGQITLAGIDGIRMSFKRYVVDFELAETHLERRAVIEWSGELAVVGRDLLNEFTFFYDGKNHRFELRDP
jgi:predicted aspartyl protease